MKKFTLIFLYLFIGIFVFAQKATTLLTEDFSGGMPPTGWTIDDMASQWSQSSGAKAGGTAPEAKLSYISGTHTTHLISPEIDLTGESLVIFSFKHFLDDYSGSEYTIGVATRSGGGSWNDVWTINPTSDMGPEIKNIIISNSDVGAADFQICIYLSGNMYNFDYWYIDDISLIVPDNNDASIQSINISPYIAQGNINIKCTIKNMGINNITSSDLSYQVDDGSIITENLPGLNLTTTQTSDYTFSNYWSATPGNHNLKVWVSNINGNGDDDYQINDTLELVLHVATQSVARIPLYEEFTSSTCSPCANFNSLYFNSDFLNNNEGNFSLIKYQMSWPSPGDPYYTAEGGVRRAYYGVSGVPTLFIDAKEGTYFNTSQLQSDLDNELFIPSFFSISSSSQIFDNVIHVNSDITPYLDAPNFTVNIVVVEKTTIDNFGNNGETEFHYVMMKMLPDATGTTINFTANTPQNINESFDMVSTFVEEMDDLAVVVFIQNNETKDIFQSAWSPILLSAVLTPSNGSVNVFIDNNIVIDFSSAVRKIDDTEITSDNIIDFIHLSDPSKGNLAYTASINNEKTSIIINPDENLSPNTIITLTIDNNSIEDTNNNAFIGGSISFTTGTETGINEISENYSVSPNPAKDFINISGFNTGKFILLDVSGKQLLSKNISSNNEQLNIQNLSSGIYILKIYSEGNIYTEKIIKN